MLTSLLNLGRENLIIFYLDTSQPFPGMMKAYLLHVLCVCVIHISFYGCNMVFLSSVTNKLNYSCHRNNSGWIKIANAH